MQVLSLCYTIENLFLCNHIWTILQQSGNIVFGRVSAERRFCRRYFKLIFLNRLLRLRFLVQCYCMHCIGKRLMGCEREMSDLSQMPDHISSYITGHSWNK